MAMAQVITTLCDECLAAGTEEPGQPYGVTIEVPGSKAAPYVIDACETHAKPVRDMLAALAEHGRRADRKTPLPRTTAGGTDKGPSNAAPAASFPCPVGGCDTVSATQAGLDSHVSKYHGARLAELRGDAEYACPARGCTRMLARPQGLSAHLRNAHEWAPDRAREAVAQVSAQVAAAHG